MIFRNTAKGATIYARMAMVAIPMKLFGLILWGIGYAIFDAFPYNEFNPEYHAYIRLSTAIILLTIGIIISLKMIYHLAMFFNIYIEIRTSAECPHCHQKTFIHNDGGATGLYK